MTLLHADARRLLTDWTAPDAEQDRLRGLYLDHLEEHVDAMWRACHPDHLTGSALVVDGQGRVLLVRHHKVGLWLQTGGHCEPDDLTLAGAALREAQEESGIEELEVDPDPVRLSRHAVACGPQRPAHHLDVQFLVRAAPGATPVRREGEDPVAWFDADALPDPTDDEVRALVSAASSRLRGTPQP